MGIYKNIFCFVFIFLTIFFLHIVYLYAKNDTFPSTTQVASDTPVLSPDIIEILQNNAMALDPISIVWKRTRTTSMDFEKLIKKTQCLYDCGFLESCNSVFIPFTVEI
jgi:hypothetical protein